ncbi:PucR family transcriptional regulator [Streptomyces sp. MUM 178J]|uniref:PucR family transcriptional regulator n=1 Tax=Streptomyces sp. MUM 178J TaxID=2791991 RepID=UPI001F035B39|nr:helix-turn-helix domain-containing protein [Streptomyces sp. MUM 178J]WRQ81746.1 helix-turn-helix domain-containing protein [Streptomyces sp. MUM 178J]
MDDTVRPAGAVVRQLLLALGDPVIGLVAAPGGLDVEINDVVILDADDEPDPYRGDLVLIIGARGRRVHRLARAAAGQGAAAVALKTEHGEDLDELKRIAEDTGIVVLGVRPEVRWAQLDSLARGVVADARVMVPEAGRQADLFALAQTVAALTGGIVSIEDSANRVLAYSRSDDEVDELRRLSILGWQGPADYLALLREWGVFDRLRAGDDVVRIDERPERGIRRRLAIGIRVDEQLLGSIWVQEGREPLAENAEKALVGAARAAALQLVRRRTGASPDLEFEQSLFRRVLEGHIDPRTFADNIGADPDEPAVVAAFTLDSGPAGGGAGGDAGRPAFEMRRATMASLISVHAAAYRRRSLVTAADSRVYMLLPGLPEQSGESIAYGLAGEIVRAAGQRMQLDVRAAIGSVVGGLHAIAQSRAEADQVLDIVLRGGGRRVATIADVRSEVLLSEALALLEQNPRLRDPRITALLAYEAEHESGLVPSVLAYLGTLGNVRAAARSLHVHPNTLRYRLKRAETVSGIDLADPHQCLFSHLQLLLENGSMAVPPGK